MKAVISILGLSYILLTSSYNISTANWIEKKNNLTQISITESVQDNSITGYFKFHLNDLKDENGKSIFNSNDLDTIVITGEGINNRLGQSVSSAGYVNGDGYSDVIVGAPGYNSNTGRAYIFYGGSSMDNIADVTFTGVANNYSFGISVSNVNDVNGDGYDDVIVGAPGYNSNTGRAYIFYGDSSMNNIADVIMSGEDINSYFGNSVSTAGDVNGDGYDDVIVGAYGFPDVRGRVYIYLGGIIMNSSPDVTITGFSNVSFGYCVSGAGDLNGDDFDDVIIGGHAYNLSTGRAYIYYGGANMNNILDITLTGEDVYNNFGSFVSSAGDVNGDGYYDVIIGAWGFNSNTGRSYIYYGGALMNNVADVIISGEGFNNFFGSVVSQAGDINRDGFSDVIIGAYGSNSGTGKAYTFYGNLVMDNAPDLIMSGESVNNNFGNSVSAAGDINGDGFSDIIVGAYSYNSNIGRAYTYFNLTKKPELLIPTNNSINNPPSIIFKWKKYQPLLFYVIDISTDSIFNTVIVNDTVFVDTSTSVNGFLKETKYFWRVKAMDTNGILYSSSVWNFKTEPPLKINMKILMEGMYFPIFNQLIRKDSVCVYLCSSVSPYNKIDSAQNTIDSLSFTGIYNFQNASPGTYYLVAKHFNCIETWSKSGGETLTNDGSTYNYDFTTSASQAYGSNLKRKGTKYCMYSGDINYDGVIDGSDALRVHSDSFIFLTGSYLPTDLNGDSVVDGSDYSIVDNNAYNFVTAVTPLP